MIITFIKSTNPTSARADAENAALLTECSQHNCGKHWSSPEIAEISRRMLFLSSSRVCTCTLFMPLQRLSYGYVLGCSCNNFVVLRADVFWTLVSWPCPLRDCLGEVSSLARTASDFYLVNTVRFLSGSLSSSDPVVFGLLATSVCLEVVVLETDD